MLSRARCRRPVGVIAFFPVFSVSNLRCCASARNVSSTSPATRALWKVADKVGLNGAAVDRLLELGNILLETNKNVNLTAVRTQEGIISKHLIDGLGLLDTLDAESPRLILDVGSGAGFPGLVLAIARPEWQITLCDSARKKTKCHEQFIDALGIQNAETVWARAEELGRDNNHREFYDVVVARAVAEMRVLAELTLPLVRVGGVLVAQKSIDPAEYDELVGASRAIHLMGAETETVLEAWTESEVADLDSARTPALDDGRKRSLVVVRKRGRTPRAFPRLPGMPKKDPL